MEGLIDWLPADGLWNAFHQRSKYQFCFRACVCVVSVRMQFNSTHDSIAIVDCLTPFPLDVACERCHMDERSSPLFCLQRRQPTYCINKNGRVCVCAHKYETMESRNWQNRNEDNIAPNDHQFIYYIHRDCNNNNDNLLHKTITHGKRQRHILCDFFFVFFIYSLLTTPQTTSPWSDRAHRYFFVAAYTCEWVNCVNVFVLLAHLSTLCVCVCIRCTDVHLSTLSLPSVVYYLDFCFVFASTAAVPLRFLSNCAFTSCLVFILCVRSVWVRGRTTNVWGQWISIENCVCSSFFSFVLHSNMDKW